MKKIILLSVVILSALLGGCSLDDVLAPAEGVKVAVMESALDTVRIPVGDTLRFKFVATTNYGSLKRVEVVDKTHDFGAVYDKAEFALVDMEDTLRLDDEGYFSRSVTTAMVLFPVAIPKDPDLSGTLVGMTFRVTNTEGDAGTVSSFFKLTNMKVEKSTQYIYNGFGYSSERHQAINKNSLWNNKKVLEFIGWVDPETSKYYLLNPASLKAKEVVESMGVYPPVTWYVDSVKSTRFIKLDKKYDDLLESDLLAMDFSEGVDMIEVKTDEVIGYETEYGRRCMITMNVNYSWAQMLTGAKHTYLVKGEMERDEVERKKAEENKKK